MYNFMLAKAFDYVFRSQYAEYQRLFGKLPSHVNGHHHMHLCANMLAARLIPEGLGVRRNFSFFRGEKTFFNRLYRQVVDAWLKQRYLVTDFFFGPSPLGTCHLLFRAFALAVNCNVELMVHPENDGDFAYLTSEQHLYVVSTAIIGTYTDLALPTRTIRRGGVVT